MINPVEILEEFRKDVGKIQETAQHQYEKDCKDLKENSNLVEYVEFANEIREEVVHRRIMDSLKNFSDKFSESIIGMTCEKKALKLLQTLKLEIAGSFGNDNLNHSLTKFFRECISVIEHSMDKSENN